MQMLIRKVKRTKKCRMLFVESGFVSLSNAGTKAVTVVHTIAKVNNLNQVFFLSLTNGKKYAIDKSNKGDR